MLAEKEIKINVNIITQILNTFPTATLIQIKDSVLNISYYEA